MDGPGQSGPRSPRRAQNLHFCADFQRFLALMGVRVQGPTCVQTCPSCTMLAPSRAHGQKLEPTGPSSVQVPPNQVGRAGGSCREATRIYLNDSKFASDPNLLRIIPRDSGGWFQDSVLEFPSWLMSRFFVERNHNVTRFSPCVPSTAQTAQRHSQNTPCDNLNSTNMQCVTCLFCSVAWHLHVTCSM